MSSENDKIEALKLKLKHVTKQRLSTEREVLKLRNKERSLSDDLSSLKREIEYLTEQLEILKRQLTQNKHQISLIEICTSLENVKNEDHVNVLKDHLKSFQELFNKVFRVNGFIEQRETELRMKEQVEKKAEYLELIRQKEMEIAKENEMQEKKVAAIETECDVIERECAVLRKRNCAILLKLRKKLLEAENQRRKRIKQTSQKNNK